MQDKISLAARILFGLAFTVFGLNGFFNFMPPPEPSPEGGAFLGALAATGYFFPFLKVVETVFGFLILIGRWVPLSLTVLASVVLNILMYHLFLDPAGLPLPIILAVLGVYLAWSRRDSFKAVLAA
jgi:uncharacterized membrane protein YphA (DoxX/SURF4 family)